MVSLCTKGRETIKKSFELFNHSILEIYGKTTIYQPPPKTGTPNTRMALLVSSTYMVRQLYNKIIKPIL